ncbi:hypothetical protein DDB_G0293656 [Dictyostelium discoideum AX4]|uniref:Probable serine/threonine-protein kinase fhkA n=1 Tax=Dictyostelium discoideum TaxID=44689 RepID=FHKA_DICDI|nr:hypothetical protein DDB_G0293656 [Dictyostelium discoideum AX4]Q54BF0.1 RecName: Full=Probable serine/threonine-protein kinase fhkA; AltName: Full=Forkhead-associated kinase protein A [Dictyostelium discoideum]EAL60640.1 hypothetical protein DDB_G0293656 [Dictyostelium discoideum AX4]|eukprot:XP_629079.1 hypothetical protein DDB_G0293656 [Dictyostelium discoideum AX4]
MSQTNYIPSTPNKSTPPSELSSTPIDENDIGLLVSLNQEISSNIHVKIKIEENITIGRSKTCNIVVPELIVSGKHCIITRADAIENGNTNYGLLMIQDQSTNGTFINGKLIGKGKSRLLKNGDKLCLGKSTKEIDISFLYKSNYSNQLLLSSSTNNLNNSGTAQYIWERKDIKDDILKDYDFIKELGSGNFSVVYEGVNKNTGKRVAIKHLNLSKINTHTPKFKSQLNREIEILKFINHENVVEIYDIFYTKDQQLFFILELANGGELYNKIGFNEPLLNENQSKFIFKQILNAVSYLHSKGIAHRDLKPENILFDSYGDDYLKIKITDFGLARFIHEGELAKTLCGSPLYVAPEVILSLHHKNKYGTNSSSSSQSPTKDINSVGYGKSCDAWSLGAILYIVLCGTPPFDDDDDEEMSTPQLFEKIVSGNYRVEKLEKSLISSSAADLVKGLLTVDPDKRLTVEQALNHPWITEINNNSNNNNNNINNNSSNINIIKKSPLKTVNTNNNNNNCKLSSPIKNSSKLKRNLSNEPLNNNISNNNNTQTSFTGSLLNQLQLNEGELLKKRKTFLSNNDQKENINPVINNPFLKSSQ